jgi:hypothetical protein
MRNFAGATADVCIYADGVTTLGGEAVMVRAHARQLRKLVADPSQSVQGRAFQARPRGVLLLLDFSESRKANQRGIVRGRCW